MTERLRNIIVCSQNLIVIVIVCFFSWDLSTQDYTNFTKAPPNTADKIWYIGEGFILLLFGLIFVVFNKALRDCYNFARLYTEVWISITIFFLIRFLWEITWVIFGVSANLNIAQGILGGILLGSITLITCLPYLKKIFNGIE